MEALASVNRDAPGPGVDSGAIASMAIALRAATVARPSEEERWDDPKFWNVEATREERCQFLAVGNSMNFRFWKLSEGRIRPAGGSIEGEKFRGAMYMWRRLRLAVQRGELSLATDALVDLDPMTFRRAFQDDDTRHPLAVAASDRVANIRDLATNLRDRWGGQFVNIVDACEGSLDRFVALSSEFRAFDDPVQKLTMLNAIMMQGSGLVEFDHQPLPAVDYHLVKQAVRQGLVHPDARVEWKLRERRMLTRRESDLLRTSVLEALIALAGSADVKTPILDNLYWANRRVCADEAPDCAACMFQSGCAKLTKLGLPLERTRYY